MEFKEWFLLEDTKIIRNTLQTHQLIYIGKIALWDVYSAVKLPAESQSYGNLSQNKIYTMQEKPPIPDDFLSRHQLKEELEKAAHFLSYLGFKKFRTTIIFMDYDKTNPITGTVGGGEANYYTHGIILEKKSNRITQDVIHEHAHMYWFGAMPAGSRSYFVEWYKKNIVEKLEKIVNKAKADTEPTTFHGFRGKTVLDKAKHIAVSNDKIVPDYNILRQILESKSDDFLYEMGIVIGLNPLDIETAREDNNAAKLLALLPRSCPHEITVRSTGDKSYPMKPILGTTHLYAGDAGEVCRIYRPLDRFMIHIRNPKVAPKDGYREDQEVPDLKTLTRLVKVDDMLLSVSELARMKKNLKKIKTKDSKKLLLRKKDVQDIFSKILIKAVQTYNYHHHRTRYLQYDTKELFNLASIYPLWEEIVIQSKTSSLNVVMRVAYDKVIDLLLKNSQNGDHTPIPYNFDYDVADRLSKPEGEILRRYATQINLTLSPYSAATFHELWAATTEWLWFDLSKEKVATMRHPIVVAVKKTLSGEETSNIPTRGEMEKKPPSRNYRKIAKQFAQERRY